MKIRNKFMLPVVGALVFFALVGTTALVSSVTSLVSTQEEQAESFADNMFLDHLQGESAGIMQNINRIANKGLEQAIIFSSLAVVQEAYQLALTGDIDDEIDPQVQLAREGLRVKMKPVIENFKKQTGASDLRLHFHLPNNRSFLRTWRSWQTKHNGKNVDLSDDLSSFRNTVVAVNQGAHQTETGIEIGRGGFVIRGVTAITSTDGQHLGSCEVYFSFASLFKVSIPKGEEHLNLAAYMDKSMLPVAKSLQNSQKYPLVDNKYVLTAASDPQLVKKIMTAEILNSGRSELHQQFVSDQLISTFPIKDFSGKTVGVFVLSHITDEIEALKSGMVASSEADLETIKTSMVVGVLAILVIICGIIYMISGAITRPIQKTVELLTVISAGDLSQDVPTEMQTRQDEMGAMAQALQAMVVNLRELLGGLAEGVTTLVSSSGELTGVSTQTAAGVNNMAERSNALAAAAEEASSNTASVATGMDQTTNSLSSVASATEEMSATVGEIASNSEKARDISEQAMNQTQVVTVTMQDLGEAAQEIDKVTETITEISSQTNLLALNATIEAARAGTAGKGFAVVAGEIKELARQTAEATEDIKKRISGIQSSTGSAISDISQINQVIQEVGNLVNSIAAGIEEQSVVTRDVAGNIAQASVEVNDANDQLAQTAVVSQSIAEDVAAVNVTVDEIRQGNGQVQDSAVQLSNLAQQLREMMEKFQL